MKKIKEELANRINFTKTSIFSGLNNITDITIDAEYGNICGYTQNDVETSFLPYLDGVDLKKLKNWYNGYNFLKNKVYNPYNILLFIQKGKLYKNYWFETGTPTFLLKLIQKNNYFLPQLSKLRIGEEILKIVLMLKIFKLKHYCFNLDTLQLIHKMKFLEIFLTY